ncbi:MAG: glycosyltransferase family 39 protein [Candidatus Rokubacteria bacterium]|nr:glycosyltransferase family 39 protein [Candidatus Rokubacteria bacterium]
MFFFNDSSRFNYYGSGQPDRRRLAFSVIWRGWIRTAHDGERRFYLATAPGGTRARSEASLAIDGQGILTVGPKSRRAESLTALGRGWHAIEVRYANPYGATPNLSAGLRREGRDEPLGADTVYARPTVAGRVTADRVLRTVSWTLDGIIVALLLGCISARITGCVGSAWRWVRRGRLGPFPPRELLAVAWLAAIIVVVLRAMPLGGFPVFLTGGDDWLTHETLARDIALNGPLMTRGMPVGQAAPFSTQPLYPYFMALVHLLIGEDFWGIYVAQELLLVGTIVATAGLAGELFGGPEAWSAAGIGVLFADTISLSQPPPDIGGMLLGEALFLPLLAFWGLALARCRAASKSPGLSAAGAGVLGGLAILTRSTLLVTVPLVTALVAMAWWARWRRAALISVGILLASLAATVGLATLRNVVASRQWVIVSSAGPINLYVGNEPPPGVDVRDADTRAIYRRLGLDPLVARVVEYAVKAPRLFALGHVFDVRALFGARVVDGRSGRRRNARALTPVAGKARAHGAK